jgi:hypothetical protein
MAPQRSGTEWPVPDDKNEAVILSPEFLSGSGDKMENTSSKVLSSGQATYPD